MTTASCTDWDALLQRRVPCGAPKCDAPARVRARLHLQQTRSNPANGCSTRTMFYCTRCIDALSQRISQQLPHTCACGTHRTHLSDVLLWVHPL